MSPRDLILVPLDGSEMAEQAVLVAVTLARRQGAALRLVHVHVPQPADPIYVEGLPVIDDHLRTQRRHHELTYLERARDRLAAGVSASVVLLDGPPAATLADHARATAATLIVMTTHGRRGFERAWLGSVAEEVIRTCPVPVLLVSARSEGAAGDFRRIVVPLDGSPLSEGILEHALHLAPLRSSAELVLIDVVQRAPSHTWLEDGPIASARAEQITATRVQEAQQYLDGVARTLTAEGARVQTRVRVASDVASAVVDATQAEEADLVALATHGRSGLKRLALGSVAERIVRETTTPILVFRPSMSGSSL
jgi:nucleotide-binding universal stress UspA family protein